jgi:mannose-6-phosphate isomerase-like protein (cupin superfamily)
MRRVVTGQTRDGKATIASDTQVDATMVAVVPGMEFFRLWGADEIPVLPDDGAPHASGSYFPPVGGFRFGAFTVPPQSVGQPQDTDMQSALAECEEKLPGLLAHVERDNPGMHTTNTIDFEYVISGEVWLELDDGTEVHLRPGDTVVQNGTRHAWRNKGSAPCRMMVCMVGVPRLR